MGGQLPAKIFRIFRYTIATDDILTPSPNPFTDKIDFNDVSIADPKDSSKERAFVFTNEKLETEGVGTSLTAEKPDGVIQPLAVIPGQYTIIGKITNTRGDADDGINAFLVLLQQWKDEQQVIKNVWNAGRFGIQDFSDTTNNLFPIGTGSTSIGLIFTDYKKTNNYTPNQVEFVLTFTRSRGLDV